jgi:hypothetical protein
MTQMNPKPPVEPDANGQYPISCSGHANLKSAS